MNIQIFGRRKCFDTKKAQRFFQERGIRVQAIDLDGKGFSPGELKSVLQAVGGLDHLVDFSKEEATLLRYLAYDGDKIDALLDKPQLCHSPVVRNGAKATIGYAPEVWKGWL